jgi:hypothetical protein
MIISGLKKQKDLIHVGLTCGRELPKEGQSKPEAARASTAERKPAKQGQRKNDSTAD